LPGRTIIIDKYGVFLGVKDGVFQIRGRGKQGRPEVLAKIPPGEVDSIVVSVPGATISAAAIILAEKHGIDLVFIDKNRPIARLVPATHGSSLNTWIKQLRAHSNPEMRREIAVSIVDGKIHNQRTLLRIYHKNMIIRGNKKDAWKLQNIMRLIDRAWNKLPDAQDWRDAAIIEAEAAKYYWRGIKIIIPSILGFRKRLKKWDINPSEPPDPFNAALNIAYSILAKEVWKATFTANLNPYIGFLHAYRPGRLSLVYDLMEEFRTPVVDRTIVKLARQKTQLIQQINQETPEETRRKTIHELYKEINNTLHNTKPPLANQIQTQARKLAETIRTGKPYKPYKMKG
jgi:CRISPR-associated protein Cas1